jgi:hypothetical protein
MLATVQLDDQAFFEADEIDNVFSQRKLTAEFQALKGAAAKPSPETCLPTPFTTGRRFSAQEIDI